MEELKSREIPVARQNQNAIVYWYPESDHGFHTLKRVLGDDEFNKVLRFINSARIKRGETRKISLANLEDKVSQCAHCEQGTSSRKLSNLGIYYSPAGIGKTTAMTRELLVGVGTDWIGKGITGHELSPLLIMKIPIITNQSEGFIGSGLKAIGVYHNNLRCDEDGIPYTTIPAIESSAKCQPKNF